MGSSARTLRNWRGLRTLKEAVIDRDDYFNLWSYNMKFSEDTINVLKNFSTINPSILFKPGQILSTVSPQKTIMAKAVIEEDIPAKGGIYELSRLLGVMSLFEDAVIQFKETHMRVQDSKRAVNYTFAEETMIVTPPEKEITFPNPEVEVTAEWNDVQGVLRAAGVMQLPEIALSGKDGNVLIEAVNSKDPTADIYSVTIGETDKEFRMIFKTENLKLINYNYNIKISSKGIAQFESTNQVGPRLQYWIATETNSSYGG